MHEEDYCDCSPGCEIPYGYCHDGCGQKTELHRYTDARTGAVRGEHKRFIQGHQTRRNVQYEERDLGYTTPCWIWLGGKSKNGYGRYDSNRNAHKVYYEAVKGPVFEGMTLDHLCHNADKSCRGGPSCVHRLCLNPSHMKQKPTGENTRAGRLPKLTRADVRVIRAWPKYYGSTKELAEKFGVHPVWISRVRNHPDTDWVEH